MALFLLNELNELHQNFVIVLEFGSKHVSDGKIFAYLCPLFHQFLVVLLQLFIICKGVSKINKLKPDFINDCCQLFWVVQVQFFQFFEALDIVATKKENILQIKVKVYDSMLTQLFNAFCQIPNQNIQKTNAQFLSLINSIDWMAFFNKKEKAFAFLHTFLINMLGEVGKTISLPREKFNNLFMVIQQQLFIVLLALYVVFRQPRILFIILFLLHLFLSMFFLFKRWLNFIQLNEPRMQLLTLNLFEFGKVFLTLIELAIFNFILKLVKQWENLFTNIF